MDKTRNTNASKQKISNLLLRFRDAKLQSIKQKYANFADAVSVIGLKEVINAGHWTVRTIWLIFILFSAAATIYFLHDVIKEFQEEPTATKIKLMKQSSYEVPSISICMKNWINDTWFEEIESNKTKQFLKYVFQLHPEDKNTTKDTLGIENVHLEEFLSFARRRNYTHMVDVLFDLTLDPSDLIDVESFNENETVKITKVYFEARTQICYYIKYPLIDTMDVYFGTASGQIKVKRNNDSNFVNIFIDADPRTVDDADKQTVLNSGIYQVKVSAKKTVSVSTANNPCESNENNILQNYSADYCHMNCITEYALALYNCTDRLQVSTPLFNKESFRQYCNPAEIDQLIETENKSDSQWHYKEANYYRCRANCRPFCKTTSYSFTLAQSYRNDDADDFSVILSINLDYVKTGVLIFEEKLSLTFASALSSIGGQLSMWLGISIVTFVQAAMYFLDSYLKKDTRRDSETTKKGVAQKSHTIG